MFKNKHISPDKPPRRLFGAIIRRLNLEKSLKIFKEKFSIFAAALAISIVLVVIAFFLFKSEMAESESGSLFSLLFSDTGSVIYYSNYFVLAVLESMLVVSIGASLIAIILLMTSLKFFVSYYDKILALTKLIKTKTWN